MQAYIKCISLIFLDYIDYRNFLSYTINYLSDIYLNNLVCIYFKFIKKLDILNIHNYQ